jgi:D-alanine-D-alanine ligase
MKTAINVLMGGPTAEFEVSIRSGIEVLKYIDKDSFTVRAVVIGKDRSLYFSDIAGNTIPSFDELSDPKQSSSLQGPYAPSASGPVWSNCMVAFLALHGSYGEDGRVQGYLESIGIPYTGSGVYASAVSMNKITSKYLYLQNGLKVPPFLICGSRFPENDNGKIEAALGFPCYVKCPQSGSSRLMGRADSLPNFRHLSSTTETPPRSCSSRNRLSVSNLHAVLSKTLVVNRRHFLRWKSDLKKFFSTTKPNTLMEYRTK